MNLRRRMVLVRLLAVAALIAAAVVAFTRPAEAWNNVGPDPAACLSYYGLNHKCVIRQDAKTFSMVRPYSDKEWKRIIDEFGVLRDFRFKERWR